MSAEAESSVSVARPLRRATPAAYGFRGRLGPRVVTRRRVETARRQHTGLHTRLFSEAVGDEGQVYPVDISAKFLEYIQ